jgi:preprotein translocase subunit SecY
MHKFLETIRNAFALPDLRKKLLYTLLIIIIFRIGAAIPVPFINSSALKQLVNPTNGASTGGIFGYIDVLTGGAFSKATIFAMSVTPYINASIIIQLLTIAIEPLARLQKEGEVGRKKIAQITRYVTVVLGVMQGLFYYLALRNTVTSPNIYVAIWKAVVIIAVFTAGTALMMWLGEQINEKGIGNGISVLLFAGIISRVPAAYNYLFGKTGLLSLGGVYYAIVPGIVILAVLVVAAIVFMNNAERRIPVQYAKRVVGRKMYGGQSTFIPIKVTMSGVMPIIFASSIVAIPGTIMQLFSLQKNWFFSWFNYNSWLYAVIYFVLIIGFNYFYVNIQYNPHEIANNLKKNNGGIPGIRPGKPTSDFIKRLLYRITLIGALFLGLIAILPILLSATTGTSIALGGTTLLIVVGVALDTMRQLESQMMMRHYKGFLE